MFSPLPRKIFYIYIVSMFLLAILPLNGLNRHLNNNFILHLRFDYITHGIMFVPWMLLSLFAYPPKYGDERTVQFLMLLSLGLIYAILCEMVQYPLPYRTFNINDMLANFTGVIAGIPLAFFRSGEKTHNP